MNIICREKLNFRRILGKLFLVISIFISPPHHCFLIFLFLMYEHGTFVCVYLCLFFSLVYLFYKMKTNFRLTRKNTCF